jgi:hypothetical protein
MQVASKHNTVETYRVIYSCKQKQEAKTRGKKQEVYQPAQAIAGLIPGLGQRLRKVICRSASAHRQQQAAAIAAAAGSGSSRQRQRPSALQGGTSL